LPSSQLTAIEYYHSAFDHYFVTTLQSEIDALDGGAFTGWHRTSASFHAFHLDADAAHVCRFWSGQTYLPKSSHFYTPFASECAILKNSPVWQFEGEVFDLVLPDVMSACTGETTALYRLFNDGMSGAPNHRYTTSLAVRSDMIAQGWVPEGTGIGVIGCVPVQ
jgi:hypothetical protein